MKLFLETNKHLTNLHDKGRLRPPFYLFPIADLTRCAPYFFSMLQCYFLNLATAVTKAVAIPRLVIPLAGGSGTDIDLLRLCVYH